MKLLYCILLLATAAFAFPKHKESFDESTSVNQYFQGLIRDDSGGYSYYCGATILTKYWLLTAARCVYWGSKVSAPADISVWTGVGLHSTNETMHQIEEIYVHKEYIKNGVDYNLTLLKLTKSLQIEDNRKPVSIIKSNEEVKVGDTLQVNSFLINVDRIVKPLPYVSMEIVKQDLCQEKYSEINNLSSTATFCGKVKNQCQYSQVCAFIYGDSAVDNSKLVGILTEETVRNYPGIFTNLSRYYDWMVKYIPELKL